MLENEESRPRILFLGMQNEMSYRAFIRLLELNQNICAVVLSAPDIPPVANLTWVSRSQSRASLTEIPIVNRFMSESIFQSAASFGIPIVPVSGNESNKIHQAISVYKPDIACVVCFPTRLPLDLLNEIEHGFLNLHPSLLPDHRGPFPLFWIFRNGEQKATGVTVHVVDDGLDSGDIVLQQMVKYDTGASGYTVDRICGELGGELLANAARGLWTGTLRPYPQPAGGSYDPRPDDSDFRLDTNWSAERAFNFMRGTAHWGRRYRVAVDGKTLELSESIAFRSETSTSSESEILEGIILIRFNPGILEARIV